MDWKAQPPGKAKYKNARFIYENVCTEEEEMRERVRAVK